MTPRRPTDLPMLADAVQHALTSLPFANRNQLAKAAGVSHTLLYSITNGTRQATPEVAAKLAKVLDQWARDCRHAARAVRRALPRRRN